MACDFALQYWRSDRIAQINFGLRSNFGLNFGLRPNACCHLKNLCKLGLRRVASCYILENVLFFVCFIGLLMDYEQANKTKKTIHSPVTHTTVNVKLGCVVHACVCVCQLATIINLLT